MLQYFRIAVPGKVKVVLIPALRFEVKDRMKKIFASAVFFVMAILSGYSYTRIYPVYGKIYTWNEEEIDGNEYKETTFEEVAEIHDRAVENRNVDSLRGLKFKTKCHVTDIFKVPSTNWKHLALYSEGRTMYNFLVPNGFLFPDYALFESIEVYYYYEVFINGTVERKDVGFEILPDARFVGFHYVAADNLRLRDTPSLDSEKTGLILKGDTVKILEVGQEEKIDRIKSAWVKVRTGDGKEGWSFGGYLTDGEIYFEKYPWEK